LLEAMKAYRREWNENHMMFSDIPVHDWASDWCDCLRYVCIAVGLIAPALVMAEEEKKSKIVRMSDYNLDTLHADRMLRVSNRRLS